MLFFTPIILENQNLCFLSVEYIFRKPFCFWVVLHKINALNEFSLGIRDLFFKGHYFHRYREHIFLCRWTVSVSAKVVSDILSKKNASLFFHAQKIQLNTVKFTVPTKANIYHFRYARYQINKRKKNSFHYALKNIYPMNQIKTRLTKISLIIPDLFSSHQKHEQFYTFFSSFLIKTK